MVGLSSLFTLKVSLPNVYPKDLVYFEVRLFLPGCCKKNYSLYEFPKKTVNKFFFFEGKK